MNDAKETKDIKEVKAVKKPARGKKKTARTVASGRAYIQATFNNTMITVTDIQGNALAWSSAGHMGFAGPKKSTPYAASLVVKDVSDKVRLMGMREVMVFVKGVGSGREAAIRALNANGIVVTAIKDITPIPHNGPRAPRPRRL